VDERFPDRSPRTRVWGLQLPKDKQVMTIIGERKNMKRNLGTLVLASAALALAVGGMSSTAAAEDADGRPRLCDRIEGTWIVQVHRVEQNITFTALQSFAAGGVVLATGTIDRTPPPAVSPLHGTWKCIGDNSYANSLSFFVFDASGSAVAMLQNYQTFYLNADDELVGKGETYVCEPSGDNCVNTNTSHTVIGKRMNAQP
jgi:hypothetical protein